MKQAELSHPRVFDQQEWAEGYYRRNKFSITRVGKDFAGILKKSGFEGGKVLDVGCGFAAVPIELARVFPHVEITGIDLGKPLLEIGKNVVKEAGFSDRITLQEGDAQVMAFDDNAFDLVINTFLLHIVEQPLRMLDEIERVTRPEGRIMIRDLRRGFLSRIIGKFKKGYTNPEAAAIIEKSGLRNGTLSNGPFWWDYMAGI